jgi:hypothetical protein
MPVRLGPTQQRRSGFFYPLAAMHCTARMELTSRFSALKTPRRVVFGSMHVWSSHDDPILSSCSQDNGTNPRTSTTSHFLFALTGTLGDPSNNDDTLLTHKDDDERRSPDNKEQGAAALLLACSNRTTQSGRRWAQKVDTTDVWLSVYNWNRCCSTAMKR